MTLGDNYITLRTNDYQRKVSVIEVQLPNPYLNIDKPERNKTLNYRIKSKFKSGFADYINHSFTNHTSNNNNKINSFILNNSKTINSKIRFTTIKNTMKYK